MYRQKPNSARELASSDQKQPCYQWVGHLIDGARQPEVCVRSIHQQEPDPGRNDEAMGRRRTCHSEHITSCLQKYHPPCLHRSQTTSRTRPSGRGRTGRTRGSTGGRPEQGGSTIAAIARACTVHASGSTPECSLSRCRTVLKPSASRAARKRDSTEGRVITAGFSLVPFPGHPSPCRA